MSQLAQQIRDAAVSAQSDVGQILRMCKVLSKDLKSTLFGDWLVCESEGYAAAAELPAYRILPLRIKGHFSGPFGSGLRHAPIPQHSIPESIRSRYTQYQCRQSVVSLQTMLRDTDKRSLYVSTGDLATVLGTNVYENMNCLDCYGEISLGGIEEILNTVRNKVLDIILELGIAENNATTANPSPSHVNQVFHTTVYGGQLGNIGGQSNVISQVQNVQQGNFDSLAAVLEQLGFDKDAQSSLRESITKDEKPRQADKFGPLVGEWLGRAVGLAAKGGTALAIGTASGVLSALLNKYYGLS